MGYLTHQRRVPVFHVEGRTDSWVSTWTRVWESRSQFERPAGISRKRFSQSINLCLHIRHWPFRCAEFEDTHVARKIILGIRVEIGVWRCDGHLRRNQQEIRVARLAGLTRCIIVQVRTA